MQKITPFLWFADKAGEAADFYTSIFANSKKISTSYYGEAGPGPKGSVMSATFQLDGQDFIALNGGAHPGFAFSPAMSLFIHCKTQDEVDHFWEKLGEGATQRNCGWVTDKFGVTWQVVPTILGELLSSPDKEKVKRVMTAMMKMNKLDIKALEDAAK